MISLTLRKAVPADLAACVALLAGSEIQQRYYAEEGALARMLTRVIVEEALLHVAATESGNVAGMLKLVPKGFCGLYPYIGLLATGKAYRGQGVARFLIDEAAAMGKEANARKIALLVSDFNPTAKAMYEHLGFFEVGLIPDMVKPGIGEYLMLKNL